MTIRPLYRDIADEPIGYTDGNAGLWYDKYCNQWQRDDAEQNLQTWSLESSPSDTGRAANPKRDWIATLAGKRVGNEKTLREYQFRQASLIRSHRMSPLIFSVDTGRFITGLGREHPVENGFAWHHTLGVPYLPGSSIKGMVRAWVEQWLPSRPDDQTLSRIFGNMTNAGAGSVIFLDALPLDQVMLEADVITPHYSPYYQGGEDTPPADWHNPVPIPFLAVAADTAFLFGVLPRQPWNEHSGEDCRLVLEWLQAALNTIGAGAKTAVGYGRFRREDQRLESFLEAMDRQLEAQRKAALSPQERVIERLQDLFHKQTTRNERDAGSELAQELVKVLDDASVWERGHRTRLSELAEKIVDFLKYGDKKKKERRQQIARLRKD